MSFWVYWIKKIFFFFVIKFSFFYFNLIYSEVFFALYSPLFSAFNRQFFSLSSYLFRISKSPLWVFHLLGPKATLSEFFYVFVLLHLAVNALAKRTDFLLTQIFKYSRLKNNTYIFLCSTVLKIVNYELSLIKFFFFFCCLTSF